MPQVPYCHLVLCCSAGEAEGPNAMPPSTPFGWDSLHCCHVLPLVAARVKLVGRRVGRGRRCGRHSGGTPAPSTGSPPPPPAWPAQGEGRVLVHDKRTALLLGDLRGTPRVHPSPACAPSAAQGRGGGGAGVGGTWGPLCLGEGTGKC